VSELFLETSNSADLTAIHGNLDSSEISLSGTKSLSANVT